MELYRSHVLVCGGTGCTSSGSQKVIDELETQLKEQGIDKEVMVVKPDALAYAHWDRLWSFIRRARFTVW